MYFFFNYGFLNLHCIFLLWIDGSGMLFFNDGFLNVKCIFSITDWWIQNFTESVNPDFVRIP